MMLLKLHAELKQKRLGYLNTTWYLRWHKNDDSTTSQEKRMIDEVKLKRWKDAAGKQHSW